MSSPSKNWLKKDMTVGSVLFFMGVMMLVLFIYYIKIGAPQEQVRLHQEQAWLNQGIVMCENTLMNDSDVCPVEECTFTGGISSTEYCTIRQNTKEQQRDINQQKIDGEQQSLQTTPWAAISFGILLSIAGAGIFFLKLFRTNRPA